MIWIVDVHTRRSCSKMYISFCICLQEDMKKAGQFVFVSSMMELDHSHSLKRH